MFINKKIIIIGIFLLCLFFPFQKIKAACVGGVGNGTIQAGETCDDGANNDKIGYCNNTCDGQTYRLSNHGYHTCIVNSEGNAQCAGRNDWGQLGDGTTVDKIFYPVNVLGLTNIEDISTSKSGFYDDCAGGGSIGSQHTCSVMKNGTAYCWGRNDQGQLGDNTTTDRSTPVQVVGPSGVGFLQNVKQISTALGLSCALLTDGTIWCWGRGLTNPVGPNINVNFSYPRQTVGFSNMKQIETSADRFYCAVKNDGTVWCSGGSQYGTASAWQIEGPGGVGFLTNVKQVSLGLLTACAVKNDGTVWCWLAGHDGSLGTGVSSNIYPAQVLGPGGVGFLTNIKEIDLDAGRDMPDCTGEGGDWISQGLIALSNDGTVRTWGDGTWTPVVGTVTGVDTISAGRNTPADYIKDGIVYQSNGTVAIGTGNTGTWTLAIVCGNGTTEGSETCDDNNTATEYCNYGQMSCQVCSGVCHWVAGALRYCGNNTTDTPEENCDDGNTANFDGCSSTCHTESGGTCGDGTANAGEECDIDDFINTCATFGLIGPTVCDNNTQDPLSSGANDCLLQQEYCYPPTSICGSNGVEFGEECDDHNTTNGDGCSSCTEDTGWACNTASPSVCTLVCGNSAINSGEQCDTNNLNGLTCETAISTNHHGTLRCLNVTNPGSNVCMYNTDLCFVCGNGIKEGMEGCDDGNTSSSPVDGCNGSCSQDLGWTCSGSGPGSCTTTQTCGNGIKEGTEGCDDGNTSSSPVDGCNGSCSQDLGWTCIGQGSGSCNITQTCGNGIKEGIETCDQGDGNVANYDGCSSTCVTESGWSCNGAPSICQLCGNSLKEGTETCDLTNFGTTTCQSLGYLGGGNLSCSIDCQTINSSACVPYLCNDGIITSPETCDGISTKPCTTVGTIYAGTQTCAGCPGNYGICYPTERCGDGILNGIETAANGCDDGNVNINDGCGSNCKAENKYICANPNGNNQPSVCILACGNGTLESSFGEICDPTHTTTATEFCPGNTTGYPGTTPCLIDCSGYDFSPTACNSTLYCGDGITTSAGSTPPGPEQCEGTETTSCFTQIIDGNKGGYRGTKVCANCTYNQSACITTESCGDHIKNGMEQCDWNPITINGSTRNSGPPRSGDGCSADCTTIEDGYTCFGDDPAINTCVFSCGNKITQAAYGEECDDGIYINTTSVAPFNGDVCTPTGYNSPCNWCTKSCKRETVTGDYCGDGKLNGPEINPGGCDDGNLNPGDGCANCRVELGYICEGATYSRCHTDCGDNICVNGVENCASCSNDCQCPFGQRPTVSATHEKGLFASVIERIKIFLVQPQPLVQIPGMDLGETKIKEEFILPPPPITNDYEIGQPTSVKIGEDYYTITVQTVDGSGSINFTIQ